MHTAEELAEQQEYPVQKVCVQNKLHVHQEIKSELLDTIGEKKRKKIPNRRGILYV
jgi:hypothetical protein